MQERQEEANGVLHYQGLPYISKIVHSELISKYHNNLLLGHFGIDQTRELIGRKYNWLSLSKEVEFYMREYDVSLASKAVKHKPYIDLQFLPVPSYQQKDFSIDFVTRLLILTNWKVDIYDIILVIIDWLKKMVYYKLIKIIINTSKLVEIILDMVVLYHSLPNSIMSNRGLLSTSKFQSSFCYFFGIKR